MKRILITGANSYIGTSFKKYIEENYSNEFQIDTIDIKDDYWKEKSFKEYDALLHVAGIAHRKETKENAQLYYEINRDLTVEVASKAKIEGVKQFIFLSSMSVYGKETGVITKETEPKPKTNYGKSKLQAEEGINKLRDEHFLVCILRPPMVYGEGCKGNYQIIVKLVKKFPIFPRIYNKRSLIHIDVLNSFIKKAVDQKFNGLFFPQNTRYVSTVDLAKDIALRLNKKIYFSFLLGLLVIIIRPFSKKIKKAFGNLVFDGNR